MPLPPLPPNNTDRAWLKYTSSQIEHELCFRVPAATPQADVIATATAIANALKAGMRTIDAFTGLRHADSGSDLSFPLAWTNIAGTSAATSENNDRPMFISKTGRSLGGYRCRITFFTALVNDATGYRAVPGASSIADMLTAAIAAATVPLVAVDGQTVIWNTYVNIGFNAYWQRQERG